MEPIAAPSAAPATAEEYIPPSPPPTPPCVSFTPPLFLQRRTTVHSVLRHISSSPRFSGKLRSVLDVGCGTDPLLLRSLIPCEDELPLERITGIDCDEEIFHPSVADSVAPGSFGGTGEAEDRWRRLDVSLLQGSFVHLTPKAVPRHDIIVSTEVIEHLDPLPLAQYAPVLLGKMRPKVCVITTPNRDFNKIFEIPFTPPDHSPLARPVISKEEPSNIGSITEGSFDQPKPRPDLGKGLIDALEAAATHLGDKPDTEFMLENPASQLDSSPSGPAEHMPEDTEKRYWREGVPYPMRHPDHRFEWTRAEFRDWAKTSAEQFGYDVAFTGVGGLDRGMTIVSGTGWGIEKSLEDAVDVFPEDGEDGLGRIDLGGNMVLWEELRDLAGTDSEGMGTLARKAKAVFGDCSQIAVFVIKESTEAEWESVEGFPTTADSAPNLRTRAGSRSEGTAEPISSVWTPLVTPDNWFAAPFFIVPDIRLVCHYNYPFLANEEYPPSYINMLEMVQETFIGFLPTLVLEEWQKTPAVLAREERERKEGVLYRPGKEQIYIDPFDLFQPPTPEILEERRRARKEIDERERCRLEEQIEIMGGIKAEDVHVVKMVVGARKVWDSSYRLQRAFRFHYDVFRRLFAELGEKGVMEFADATSYEWTTIIDTTGTVGPRYHSAERMFVELTTTWDHDFVKMTINPPDTTSTAYYGEYTGHEILPPDSSSDDKSLSTTLNDPQNQHHTSASELAPGHPSEEAFWDAWDDSGDGLSVDDNYVHRDDENDFNGNWYHDDADVNAEAGIQRSKPLKVHTVAVWGLINSSTHESSIKEKGKGKEGENDNRRHFVSHLEIGARMETDLGQEEGILRVGRNGKAFLGEEIEAATEWQEGDIPIVITYFKPQRIINYYDSGIGEGSYGAEDGASAGIQDEAGVEGSLWNGEGEDGDRSASGSEAERKKDTETW